MVPTAKEYDYIVIGGGSGGSGTARRASGRYKAKTLIIENSRSGGCCVNEGCVPKKISYNFAAVNETIHNAKQYGYTVGNVSYDWAAFKKKRDAKIEKLNSIYEQNWENDGIDLVHGTATFVGPKELEVEAKDGSKTRFRAPHITIAVGGYAQKPPIEGAELGGTSDDFFTMEQLPKKVALVGGGYIAIELAGIFQSIGVETHLFIRKKQFLRKFDSMLSETAMECYENMGMHVHKESPSFTKVEKVGDQLRCHNPDGSYLDVDRLIWAVGRAPKTKDLGLDIANVKTNEKGHIEVDEFQNTSAKGIYAIGDVTGQVELTPVAIAAGRRLGDRLFGPAEMREAKLSYEMIASVIFSHPPIGTVGLSQADAEEKYGKANITVFNSSFKAMWYDVFPEEERQKHPTKYKLVCQGPEKKVVGLHIIGEASDEILQGFSVAIKMGATKQDFDNSVAIHPTSAEELVTLT